MSSILNSGSPLDKGSKDTTVTDFKRKVAEAINDPGVHMMLMQPFMEYVTQYQALNQVPIPISQIFGFSQFAANYATVATQESTTSATYTNLGTTGPELTGLPDGAYLILHGCNARSGTSSQAAIQSVQINGVAAGDGDASIITYTDFISGAVAIVKTLEAGGNNTITAKYRSTSGTATFQNRWLIALRYANA